MTTRRLDARALIALAHPLRIQLRDHLRRHGPATATQLAKQLGESSGATSYHLRMLARHGFIEAEPGRGRGRERWWRAAPGWLQIDADEPISDAAAREAVRTIETETHRLAAERLRSWLAESDRWSRAWRNGSTDSTFVARLDASRMAALRDELTAVIARYVASESKAEARSVEIQLNIFPVGAPE